MNKKQRTKNRATALKLKNVVMSKHVCENCGESGYHWIEAPHNLFLFHFQHSGMKISSGGFWTCSKYYDPVTKRRILES